MEQVETLMKTVLAELEKMVTTRTVVGEPMTVEGNTLIPLVSVGFGFGGGGGSGKGQKDKGEGLGAGSGGYGSVKPVAVIVIDKAGVRIEPVKGRAASLAEGVASAISSVMEKRKEEKTK
ncbi:MAG: sporulation protein YtfJ [Chloroflexi bacterium]|nr:MAG: sporulation protein YtfJ [Chloroflexota bacterium]